MKCHHKRGFALSKARDRWATRIVLSVVAEEVNRFEYPKTRAKLIKHHPNYLRRNWGIDDAIRRARSNARPWFLSPGSSGRHKTTLQRRQADVAH